MFRFSWPRRPRNRMICCFVHGAPHALGTYLFFRVEVEEAIVLHEALQQYFKPEAHRAGAVWVLKDTLVEQLPSLRQHGGTQRVSTTRLVFRRSSNDRFTDPSSQSSGSKRSSLACRKPGSPLGTRSERAVYNIKSRGLGPTLI